ncbi:BspA family leucine-rich repeat surface protein [Mycoplasmopsis agalactiae]|uniref:Lipoprotein n=1 Tax=Mycoplasmopsis agalactiae TaxID=2110 RepID=D3VPZ0_MYCAA|nr:BspA family leucine-rich repeat surface protein [Mycoplasmopsis agalactiae]KAB6718728.1 BspA family leucine-rich repeat surface protein [Mycoplasmopsis agalactiae]CBH40257.1 Hypothetical protein, predicted lipoprotein, DUF285 family [Mycoplasmopsis agalactiae]
MKTKHKFFLIASSAPLLLTSIAASCTKNKNGNKNTPINSGNVVVSIVESEGTNTNKQNTESNSDASNSNNMNYTSDDNVKNNAENLPKDNKYDVMPADQSPTTLGKSNNLTEETYAKMPSVSEKTEHKPVMIEEKITTKEQKSLKEKIVALWKKHKYGFADFHTYGDVLEQLKVYINDKSSKFLKLSENKLTNQSIKKDNSKQIIDLLIGEENLTLRFGDIKDSVPLIYAIKGDESNETVSYIKENKELKVFTDKDIIVKQLGYFKGKSADIIVTATVPENTVEVPEHLPLKIDSLTETFAGLKKKEVKNLDKWDTKNIKNLLSTFSKASNFDQLLDKWDTSNVKSMASTFFEATSFNQPLSSWNTSNVTSMYSMFSGAQKFNQDISGWKTDNVTDMADMFWGASSFNGELDSWNVSNVQSMDRMFAETDNFNQELKSWKVEKVLSMYGMFGSAKSFDRDISHWKLHSAVNHQHFTNKDSKLQQKHMPPKFRTNSSK